MKEIVLYEDEDWKHIAKIGKYIVRIIHYDKGDHGSLFETDNLILQKQDIIKIYNAIKEEE